MRPRQSSNHPFFRRKIDGIPVNLHLSEQEYEQHADTIKPTIIDRGGLMTATDVLGVIPAHGAFSITVPHDNLPIASNQPTKKPTITTFKAHWYTANEKEVQTASNANTFGRSGTLEIINPPATLSIRATNARHLSAKDLAKLGATIYPVNSVIHNFNTTPYPLAVVTYHFDADYTKKYIFDATLGGGAFLERHNARHMWAPLHPACTGALILGNVADDNQYSLSGVSIPFGYALALDANALHADCFLVGDYAMALSAHEDADASTVIFRKPAGDMQPVEMITDDNNLRIKLTS